MLARNISPVPKTRVNLSATRRPTLKSAPSPQVPVPDGFEVQLRSTVARLRESVAEVLSAVGANARAPHTITRDFGVDKNLTSKLARVVRETDLYAAALDVPGPEAMRIFAHAMREAGASPAMLEALNLSAQSFQEFVRKHCGDRATLDMLVANSSDARTRKQQQQLATFRKNMFRGASAVFGVQARVHVSSHYIAPNRDDPEMVDLAIVGGLVDLRRIRGDVAWAIASMRIISRPGMLQDMIPIEPLDPTSSKHGEVPLLPDFCSSPLPAMRVVSPDKTLRRFVLEEGPVGVAHSVTIFTGWLTKKICSRWKMSEDDN